ncbi:MAG: putative bifunctional diguanylate cyclase/phosphodiesterase, partial [Pontibacterium sp.]
LTNIHKLVQTDSLTGLPNRSAFQEHARNNLVRVNQANTSLSVIYIDLDNFKFVNDKYGHEIGDALLIAVADSFAKIVRPFGNGAETYRLSGDEFVALLPFADHQAAQRTGLEIIELFKSGYSFSLGHFPVTVSLGVATYPNDGTTLSKLTSNADLAMYQAKKSGKNRLATYSRQLAAEDRRIREIDTRLKALNCDDEFCIVYMPISDPSGRICGCEALLRWESPVLGAVPAADFIPIAESTGSFKKIDTWVLDRTFQDAAAIFERLPADGQIAINISSAQLASSQFVNVLSQLVKKHRIPPHKFTLEITETFELHKNTSVLDRLNDLRKLGFKVAIDDFGTGYTSLMQMVDYPVDSIKFDMHLTQRITTPEKQGIGIALIALCHLQNMHVVAEGIEEAEQLAFLCDAGCDFLQGFYLGEPLPLDAWLAWLDTHQDLADRSLSPAT